MIRRNERGSNYRVESIRAITAFAALRAELYRCKDREAQVNLLLNRLPLCIRAATGSAYKWQVLQQWRTDYLDRLRGEQSITNGQLRQVFPAVVARSPARRVQIPEYDVSGGLDLGLLELETADEWRQQQFIVPSSSRQEYHLAKQVMIHSFMKALYALDDEHPLLGQFGRVPEIVDGFDAMGQIADALGATLTLTKEMSIAEKHDRLRVMTELAKAGLVEIRVVLGATAVCTLPNEYPAWQMYAKKPSKLLRLTSLVSTARSADRVDHAVWQMRMMVDLSGLTVDEIAAGLDEGSGLLLDWRSNPWSERIKAASLVSSDGKDIQELEPYQVSAMLAGVPPFLEYWSELKQRWYPQLVAYWQTMLKAQSLQIASFQSDSKGGAESIPSPATVESGLLELFYYCQSQTAVSFEPFAL